MALKFEDLGYWHYYDNWNKLDTFIGSKAQIKAMKKLLEVDKDMALTKQSEIGVFAVQLEKKVKAAYGVTCSITPCPDKMAWKVHVSKYYAQPEQLYHVEQEITNLELVKTPYQHLMLEVVQKCVQELQAHLWKVGEPVVGLGVEVNSTYKEGGYKSVIFDMNPAGKPWTVADINDTTFGFTGFKPPCFEPNWVTSTNANIGTTLNKPPIGPSPTWKEPGGPAPKINSLSEMYEAPAKSSKHEPGQKLTAAELSAQKKAKKQIADMNKLTLQIEQEHAKKSVEAYLNKENPFYAMLKKAKISENLKYELAPTEAQGEAQSPELEKGKNPNKKG